MDYKHSIDEKDQTLGCVCLLWSAGNDMDHTLEPATFSKNIMNLMAEKLFNVKPLGGILGKEHSVRPKYVSDHSPMYCVGLSIGFVLIDSSVRKVMSARK